MSAHILSRRPCEGGVEYTVEIDIGTSFEIGTVAPHRECRDLSRWISPRLARALVAAPNCEALVAEIRAAIEADQ